MSSYSQLFHLWGDKRSKSLWNRLKFHYYYSTRIDLLTSKRQLPTNCPHELFPKYEIPKSKKERKDAIKRRENLEEELNFCKFPLLRLPSPTTNAKLEMTVNKDFGCTKNFP